MWSRLKKRTLTRNWAVCGPRWLNLTLKEYKRSNVIYISSNPGGVSPFTKDYYTYYVPICLSMRLNKKVLKTKKKMTTPHLQPIEERPVALCCTEGP